MADDKAVCVRRHGSYPVFDQMKGFVFEYLGGSTQMELLRIRIRPGGTTQSFDHAGEECHFVLEGELEVEVDGDVRLIREGDCIWHRSDRPHRWRNRAARDCVVLSVATPRTYVSTVVDLRAGRER